MTKLFVIRSESSDAPTLNHRTKRGLFSRRVGSMSPSSSEYLQSSLSDEISPETKTLLLLKKKKKRKGHALVTFEELATATATTTSYLTCYSTTNTFFIQGCTPSPFPFVTCPWGKAHLFVTLYFIYIIYYMKMAFYWLLISLKYISNQSTDGYENVNWKCAIQRVPLGKTFQRV